MRAVGLTIKRSRPPLTPRKTIAVVMLLALVLVATFLLGLSVGSVDIPLAQVSRTLLDPGSVDASVRVIVLEIRLPRVLLAVLVGAALSVAGVVFQAMLRNPLAEPYILGISSGGTMGTILAISFGAGFSLVTTPLASFLGSASVTLLVYVLAHRRGQLDPAVLLLSGVMVGAFFNAAVLLTIALFDQELRNALLWLMGHLGGANARQIAVLAPPIILVAIFLMIQARNYNLIATGDESALQLGVEVRRVKRLSYFFASCITGLVVSVSGVIGFVGLIIPHICRILFGPDHRLLLPAAFLTGAIFMIIADVLSRTLLSPMEIPVGAVTAAIGAPLFVYLLKKT